MSEAFVVDVVRTPSGKGKAGGALAHIHPVDLLAETLAAIVSRTGVPAEAIDDVLGGCVSQVGEQALNVTRHAVLAADFPHTVPATTIDRQCGSSQQALAFGSQAIRAGAADLVIACGVESMSRVAMFSSIAGADPYGSRLARRFPNGLPRQGICAERVAQRWDLRRTEVDEFAVLSHQRAIRAWEAGWLDDIVIGIDGVPKWDETVRARTSLSTLAGLPAAFATADSIANHPELDWLVTAGNSSPLTDGASAALLASERAVHEHGLMPRGRIAADVVVGDDPELMLMGVIPATEKALKTAGLSVDDIAAFEVNEAFASVPLAWQRCTGVDPSRLNPLGGAIAYGHPLGASGIRLLGSLLAALDHTSGRYGLQTMCEAGGMANATIVERV